MLRSSTIRWRWLHKTLIFSLVLDISFRFLIFFAAAADVAAFERSLLLQFKQSVSDPGGLLSGWTPTDSVHCSWFGVSCNSGSRVTSLNITATSFVFCFDAMDFLQSPWFGGHRSRPEETHLSPATDFPRTPSISRNLGDRFIPVKGAMDFDIARFLLRFDGNRREHMLLSPSQTAECTLDAPDLVDDYYLNLLDRILYLWNATNHSDRRTD